MEALGFIAFIFCIYLMNEIGALKKTNRVLELKIQSLQGTQYGESPDSYSPSALALDAAPEGDPVINEGTVISDGSYFENLKKRRKHF